MKATFIEMSEFSEWISQHLSDKVYASLQQQLMDDPDTGAVMTGCGGLRKIRTGDPKRGKGKRGGARVIYLYIPEAKRFYLLDVYGKNEKDDLSAKDKKHLKKLAQGLTLEAIAAYKGWLKENG